jgi:nucleotide-binding universal stress UspA family protein
MEESCRLALVRFERHALGGRQHRMILEDIHNDQYDLVIMGALGAGAVDESQIGSVTDRVVRGSRTDILIVKDLIPDPDGRILVALDGSEASLQALGAAVEFARSTGHTAEGIVVGQGRLSGRASAALESARAAAAAEGAELSVTVTEGKPFDRILKHCRERRPWLLVVGKTGADMEEGDEKGSLGSTTDNLLRMVPCNILVTPSGEEDANRDAVRGVVTAVAPVTTPPRRTLKWAADAERLLADIPADQRFEVIRTVEDGARRMGVLVVTAETIDKVMLGYIDT